MKLSDFDYPLPKELIAQRPLAKRDASRLLVVERKSGKMSDRHFSEIAEYFSPGDALVMNNTKVFPARILGRKKGTGGKVDILLISPAGRHELPLPGKNVWRCLVQPSLKEGQEIVLDKEGIEAVFLERDRDKIPLMDFKFDGDLRLLAEKIGTMPLPPYIKRDAEAADKECYQTVYAEREGAVAAPTAGLHFTKELLREIKNKGMEILYLTLHVGYGTFKPVEDLEKHQMHAENFELSLEVARQINEIKAAGKKIWAVGTTSLRVLETCVQDKKLIPGKGETDLFIKEPFHFEAVDGLVTNFHLPKTTLLLLVSAFMGEKLRKKAYDHAIENKYRFYSYGDAMLIV